MMVTTEDRVWDDYIAAHPDTAMYRLKRLPDYLHLAKIFGVVPPVLEALVGSVWEIYGIQTLRSAHQQTRTQSRRPQALLPKSQSATRHSQTNLPQDRNPNSSAALLDRPARPKEKESIQILLKS
ncbi:hypothetical protein AAC387_Pa09g0690 [Persea americana]